MTPKEKAMKLILQGTSYGQLRVSQALDIALQEQEKKHKEEKKQIFEEILQYKIMNSVDIEHINALKNKWVEE